jgi:hypothetical protein
MLYFYGASGEPAAFSPDHVTLYLWSGQAAAYVTGGMVYAFNGRHLGWYVDGWLTDRDNTPALFTQGAAAGPSKPSIKQFGPKEGQPKQLPMKAMPARAPMPPALRRTWSPYAGARYFGQ